MASIIELQVLADRLTELAPPPALPKGVNMIAPNTGRWVVKRVGAGFYALRAHYDHTDPEVVEPIEVTIANELRGYPSTMATALHFSVTVLDSPRHQWLRV